MKKFLSLFITLLAVVLLVACVEKEVDPIPTDDPAAPTIAGADGYVILAVGEDFDPLANVTANDEVDGSLTANINLAGEVDVDTAGFYVLTYTVTNSEGVKTTVIRYVVVGEAPVFDGVAPVRVIIGQAFDLAEDVSAIANPGSEVDLTDTIDIDNGGFNKDTLGEYEVTYSVTNAFGITSTVKRLVVVRPEPAPVFTGATNQTIPKDSAFDPEEGVDVYDELDDELSMEDVTITGSVNTAVLGTYNVTYSVTNANDLTTTLVRVITVADALLAQGSYSFRYSESSLRNTFFAAAEKYLLLNGAGGIPVFANAGFSIFSPRVQLPWDNYLPVLGFGTGFATLSADDSTVNFVDTSAAGQAGKYTYRAAVATSPGTFNQWVSDDSGSSDVIAPSQDALYDYFPNETQDGYVLAPSMAELDPQPTNPEQQGAYEVAKVWTVKVKDGLEWAFHPSTDTAGLDPAITAKDFVETYKYALDNDWFRAISGGGHFWAATNTIVGAEAYYKAEAEDRDWDSVGLSYNDATNEITYTFVNNMSEWDVKYWLSSNSITPVHLGLAEKLGTNYGTTNPANVAYTGQFIISHFEADKVVRYEKNLKHHSIGGDFETNFTGYNYAIIEDAQNRWQEFVAGNLDTAGVPTENFDSVKDNPGLKRVPGTTTFRLMVNGLGTDTAQQLQFPGSTYSPKPILSSVKFKQAMFHAVDRKHLAEEVLKTSQPQMYHFTDAYLVDPQFGIPFRSTEEAEELVNNMFGTGTAAQYGYSKDAAIDLFEEALDDLIAQGYYKAGTAASPTVINLDLFIFSGSAAQDLFGQYIKETFEETFNDTSRNIKVQITVEAKAFPGIYYDYMMTGEFDLAIGGISGSTLDASGFLDVYASDNRGGFTLNWGIDTSVAEIVVEYTNDADVVVREIWSYDAIVAALTGEVFVEDGVESEAPAAE